MSRAFPYKSDCPVPSNEAISGSLTDCSSLTPPPPALYCFDPFIVPTPDPTAFDFGCYGVGASGRTVRANRLVRASVRYPNAQNTGACQPVIGIDVNCPSPEGSIKVVMNAGPGGRFDAIPVNPDACEYKFDIDIDVPCPQISSGDTKINFGTDTADAHFNVKDNSTSDQCSFSFDFNFNIPCPSMSVSAAKLIMNTGPFANLKITSNPTSSGCPFDFDMSLGVPCPSLSVVAATLIMNTGPFAALNIKANPTSSNCPFDFDMSLGVPCPSFTFGGEIRLGSPLALYSMFFKKGTSSDCGGSFSIGIDIPCPKLKIGTAALYMFPPTWPPYMLYQVTESSPPCDYTFDLVIGVPYTPCPDITVESAQIVILPPAFMPYLNFYIRKSETVPCQIVFDLFIGVPIPCPEIKEDPPSDIQIAAGIATTDAQLLFSLTPDDTGDKCKLVWTIKAKIPLVDVEQPMTSDLAEKVPCCTAVRYLDPDTLELNRTPETCNLHLAFGYKSLIIPKMEMYTKEVFDVSLVNGATTVLGALGMVDNPLCKPCGQSLQLYYQNIGAGGQTGQFGALCNASCSVSPCKMTLFQRVFNFSNGILKMGSYPCNKITGGFTP